MKKTLLMIQMAVCLFGFMACSSSDDDNNIQEMEQVKIKQSDLIGVWTSGDFFVSFSSEGFFSAYIADDFIGCGDYSLQKKDDKSEIHSDTFVDDYAVIAFDDYTQQNTIIHIKRLTVNEMEAEFYYPKHNKPYENIKKLLILSKTDTQPSEKNHKFIGYSFTDKCVIEGDNSTVTTMLVTYNIGQQTTNHEKANMFPIELKYICFNNMILFQRAFQNNQISGNPIIEGWNNYTDKVFVHIIDDK